MSEPDYNLLDEEWIPVLLEDGSVRQMGIKEVFVRANKIIDLACELPTQKIAVQRLLLAVCYRVIPVKNAEDWRAQWIDGVPTDTVLEYLERWRERFFLFGGRYPFMQAPDLRTAKDAVSGLEKIIADIPNGEPFFTTRHGQSVEFISAAEAAMWLVHVQAYDPSGIRSGAVGDTEAKGGKGYPIGPSWVGQTGTVWLKGANLDETLILNLVPHEHGGLRGPTPQDPRSACTWESDVVETAVRRDYTRGADPDPDGYGVPRLLTWHSRRIRLVGDRLGVSGVVLAQGDKLGPQNMHLYEPMSLWRYSEPQSKKYRTHVYMPRKYEPGRAFWRSLPGALPNRERIEGFIKGDKQERFRPSATLEFHAGLDTSNLARFPVRIQLEAVGIQYGAQEATFEDIYHDQVTLASVILKGTSAQLQQLIGAQERATEEVARAIGNLGANLAQAGGERGDGAGDGARERAKERFYALVDDPFRAWLSGLSADSDVKAEAARWLTTARAITLGLAGELLNGAPRAAVTGRDNGTLYISAGVAENFFRSALNKAMPLSASPTEGDSK